MRLLVLGVSHHTAPIDLRERLAFAAGDLSDAVTTLARNPALAAGIAAIRDQLVGEHIGRKPEEVAELMRTTGSLLRTIQDLTGENRGLRRLEVDPEPWVSQLVLNGTVVDPNYALVTEPIVIPPSYRLRRGRHRMWPMVAALVAAGALGYRALRASRLR